ncbi:hypothetical protein DSO57_1003359 [Entomophthora muscae]|uniref:Uncharacterized protein n=1 Tax=Entomophthora muscae TaxID=34485 RepID=A0ACC2SY78_9FUNG|nr:hypothetical protein DSO57_1003359 [Entomophthora muscae]
MFNDPDSEYLLSYLPSHIILEILQYLRKAELIQLRLFTRRWKKLVDPLVCTKIAIPEVSKGLDSKPFRKFLETYGSFVTSLDICRQDIGEVFVLNHLCPKVSSITVNLSDQHTRAKSVEVLAKSFKKLHSAYLYGALNVTTLNYLSSVTCRLTSLTLEFSDLHSELGCLRALESETLKYLSIINFDLYSEDCSLILVKNRSLERFSFASSYDHNKRVHGFSYDVVHSKFNSILFQDSCVSFAVEIVFADAIPQIKLLNEYAPEQDEAGTHLDQFRRFDACLSLFSADFSFLKSLPRIEALRVTLIRHVHPMFQALMSNLPDVNQLALDIDSNETFCNLALPIKTFPAKSLYFCPQSRPVSKKFFTWLAECFPKLEKLYLPMGFPLITKKKMGSLLRFKNLRKVYSYRNHTIKFWRKLVAASPKLTQINLPTFSGLHQTLSDEFPRILIGLYSDPDHFKEPFNHPPKVWERGEQYYDASATHDLFKLIPKKENNPSNKQEPSISSDDDGACSEVYGGYGTESSDLYSSSLEDDSSTYALDHYFTSDISLSSDSEDYETDSNP